MILYLLEYFGVSIHYILLIFFFNSVLVPKRSPDHNRCSGFGSAGFLQRASVSFSSPGHEDHRFFLFLLLLVVLLYRRVCT
jgi:hypothetical protein